MTIRLRMAILFVVALFTAAALVVVSHWAISRAFEASERFVERDLARSQARAGIRESLDRIRRAQDRIGRGTESAGFQAELVRQHEVLEGRIDAAKSLMTHDGQGSHDDMRTLATSLRSTSERWIDAHGTERAVLEATARRLEDEARTLDTRASTLAERVDALREDAGRIRGYLAVLALFVAVPEVPSDVDAIERETFSRLRVDRVAVFKDPRGATSQLARDVVAEVESLAARGEAFARERRSHARLLRELIDRREDAIHLLGVGADTLVTDLDRDVDTDMTVVRSHRYTLWQVLVGVAVVGAAACVGLIVLFVAGLERDVRALHDVAASMERGDLVPKTTVEAGGRELAEVGRAFNRLAGTLAGVRERQTAYNRVVTGLNRNVYLHEILRFSLVELARSTRAKAGCIYLKVAGREELLLAETYAVPRGASTPEVIRFGDGQVGEVARTREVFVADDVPRRAMKIVSATVDADIGSVVVVPILYKDELMGVLELAGLSRFDADAIHLIEDVVLQMAVAVNNARAIETIKTNQMAIQRKAVELEELNVALEHANQLKSEFLATVSHELRTPLNAIIGFSELVLETDRTLSGASRDNVAKVFRNAENLLALINDILDLSKIEAGKMDLVAETFAPGPVVADVVDDFRSVATRKQIELTSDLGGAPAEVNLDRDKFRRIVLNLLSNAVKFTDTGSVAVRLGLEQGRLRLEVRDTGIGIEPENLPRIFEKFRQADGSVTRRFGGTGLGLSITRELCHLLGGRVRVLSQLGRGSTFTVTLPLRLPASGGEAERSQDSLVATVEVVTPAPGGVPDRGLDG